MAIGLESQIKEDIPRPSGLIPKLSTIWLALSTLQIYQMTNPLMLQRSNKQDTTQNRS